MNPSNDDLFLQIFQAHPVPMWVYDVTSLKFVVVNDAAIANYGFSEAEFLTMTIADIRPPEDQARLQESVRRSHTVGYANSSIWTHRRRDGSPILVEITSHAIDFAGRKCRMVMAHDVTLREQAEGKVERLTRIYAVLSGINSAIVRIRDRTILLEEACRIAVEKGGFRLAWIGEIDAATSEGRVVAWFGDGIGDEYVRHVQFDVREGAAGSDRPASLAVREMRPVICADVQAEPSLQPVHALLAAWHIDTMAALPLLVDGKAVAALVLSATRPHEFDDDEMRLLGELASDISFGLQYIEREKQLSYLALHDLITGLPNRALFVDRLAQQLHATRQTQGVSTLILLNVDHFNEINEQHGRTAGDRVLRTLAQRWLETLQEPFTLARLGGDVFGVAVANLPAGADAVTILRDRLFKPLESPLLIGDTELWLSVRAGVALYPDDGEDAETLLKHAEAALKQCTKSGKRYTYYDSQLNTRIVEKLSQESELRAALAAGEFELHYQPRVALYNGAIVGAEALIRWRHPQRGMVPPAQFIPLAEETGLIVPIGRWVIEAVCAQLAEWRRQRLSTVPIAINVSAVQLGHEPLKRQLQAALAAAKIDPALLQLELTESAVMQDPVEAGRILRELRGLGLRLSLDDFGTGYSSLAYLKQFPFDFIKIDRTFVSDITRNPDDAAIATAIIAMARRLRRQTVAEGVETEAQLRYLERNGCDEIQGFYASKPVPADAFVTLLGRAAPLIRPMIPSGSERVLLLVDDEASVLSALRRTLGSDHYTVLTANSGPEALEQLALNQVQVIVSDQSMPGMSGTEFLAIARQLYPRTACIMLSALADSQIVTAGTRRGEIYKFLTKPWADEELQSVIADAFLHNQAGQGYSTT